jgi:DNA primase
MCQVLHLPGMPKREVLYNFDGARDVHFVIVVEGITDVWRIGDPAVAILGKTISPVQAELLRTTWRHKPIVVMLDGEARAEADAIVDKLAQSGDNPVVAARLPVGVDPADLSEDEVWQVIRRDTERVGIRLT